MIQAVIIVDQDLDDYNYDIDAVDISCIPMIKLKNQNVMLHYHTDQNQVPHCRPETKLLRKQETKKNTCTPSIKQHIKKY